MLYVPVLIHDHVDDFDVFTIKGHNSWTDNASAKATAQKERKAPYDAGVVDKAGKVYSYEWRATGYAWKHFGDIDVDSLVMK